MDIILVPILQGAILILDIYIWFVIGSVILSWLVAFNVINMSNKFVYMIGDFLYRVTEPALGRIRKFMPNLGGIDLSPIVLIVAIQVLRTFFVQILVKL